MSIFTQIENVSFLPKRAIGQFQARVTVEEIADDSLEITQHPIEQGASITDHAYVKPAMLRIEDIFTDFQGPLAEQYSNLLKLQAQREPIKVITGKRTYNNMLIKSLTQINDVNNENILRVRFLLQEVNIVSFQTISVAQRSDQANPGETSAIENSGQKSLQQPSSNQFTSILNILFGT